MLQVIALASIAAVVFTVALFALAGVHESAQRVAGQARSALYVPTSPHPGEMASQPSQYQPIVNLNVVLPFSFAGDERAAAEALRDAVVGSPRMSTMKHGPTAEYVDGTARAVVPAAYRHPQGGANRAPAPAYSEWRAQLDVTA